MTVEELIVKMGHQSAPVFVKNASSYLPLMPVTDAYYDGSEFIIIVKKPDDGPTPSSGEKHAD